MATIQLSIIYLLNRHSTCATLNTSVHIPYTPIASYTLTICKWSYTQASSTHIQTSITYVLLLSHASMQNRRQTTMMRTYTHMNARMHTHTNALSTYIRMHAHIHTCPLTSNYIHTCKHAAHIHARILSSVYTALTHDITNEIIQCCVTYVTQPFSLLLIT